MCASRPSIRAARRNDSGKELGAIEREANRAGVWRLGDGGVVPVETFDAGPATVLVPSEAVLTLIVDLPLPSRARRAAALPFAIEDRLAEPLADTHVALGAEIAPRRHVAGAVRHAVMIDWLEAIDAAGLAHARLVPDALALPAPGWGAWSVAIEDGRARVRTDEGLGFALPEAAFAAAWEAGGRPPCAMFAGAAPPGVTTIEAADPLEALSPAPALDLRQGPYAVRGGAGAVLARRLGMIVALGLVAHGVIAGADALALRNMADTRAGEARLALSAAAPGFDTRGDLNGVLDRLRAAARPREGFLPTLATTARALEPVPGGVTLTGLTYAAEDGALRLAVEAADLAGIERIATALRSAGLEPAVGAASVADGRADAEISVGAR